MRKIKPEFDNASTQPGIVILRNIPHQGLVKANRTLLLIASVLMVVVFVLGFLLVPEDNMLTDLQAKNTPVKAYNIQNPVLSAEINTLKGQLVGLVSGSIESKLRSLEVSIRTGSVNVSLGTIQDLKNDVKVLQAYSIPEKTKLDNQNNQALLQEVSQLKRLIYLTVTSCGLMLAAIAGFWVRKHFYLADNSSDKIIELGRQK